MSLLLGNCLAEPSYVMISLAGWSMQELLYAVYISWRHAAKEYVFLQCLLGKDKRLFCLAPRHPVRQLDKGLAHRALKQRSL